MGTIRRLVVALLTATAVAGCTIHVTPSIATSTTHTARINLNPSHGPVGTEVAVAGDFWPAGEVRVRWDCLDTPTQSGRTDENGSFDLTFVVPDVTGSANAFGDHLVCVDGGVFEDDGNATIYHWDNAVFTVEKQ